MFSFTSKCYSNSNIPMSIANLAGTLLILTNRSINSFFNFAKLRNYALIALSMFGGSCIITMNKQANLRPS